MDNDLPSDSFENRADEDSTPDPDVSFHLTEVNVEITKEIEPQIIKPEDIHFPDTIRNI